MNPRLILASLAVVAMTGQAIAGERPSCTITAAPRVSLAPLTYLRIITHVDDPASLYTAVVTLADGFGPVRTSVLWEGRDAASKAPRTIQTEWRNLHLGADSYEVRLITSDGHCADRQTVEVGGHE